MARACQMSISRARKALKLLETAGLIQSVERPGYSTIHRLTPKYKWVHPERLEGIRQCLTSRRSDTPSKSDLGVLAELIPLPLPKVTAEGIPLEGNPIKVLPSCPLNLQRKNKGREVEFFITTQSNPSTQHNVVATSHELTSLDVSKQLQLDDGNNSATGSGASYLTLLPQHLDASPSCIDSPESDPDVTHSTKPSSAAFVPEAKADSQPASSQPKFLLENSSTTQLSVSQLPKQHHTGWAASSNSPIPDEQPPFEAAQRTQLLAELSRLTNESIESLRLNTNLTSALDRHPLRVKDALAYFKQASTTWKNKPGLGLFISAINKGAQPSATKPGGGWKEWADEALRRRLMSCSHSWNSDIRPLAKVAMGCEK
jgi:hypothetical protein